MASKYSFFFTDRYVTQGQLLVNKLAGSQRATTTVVNRNGLVDHGGHSAYAKLLELVPG
jgi:hypothetical protein